jgi:hypothetical protein
VTTEPASAEGADRLPLTYQRVLAWLEEGCDQQELARRLQVDPQAVGPLVALAEAKLARLQGSGAAEEEGPGRLGGR